MDSTLSIFVVLPDGFLFVILNLISDCIVDLQEVIFFRTKIITIRPMVYVLH